MLILLIIPIKEPLPFHLIFSKMSLASGGGGGGGGLCPLDPLNNKLLEQ